LTRIEDVKHFCIIRYRFSGNHVCDGRSVLSDRMSRGPAGTRGDLSDLLYIGYHYSQYCAENKEGEEKRKKILC